MTETETYPQSRKELLDELRSPVCWCGAAKQIQRPFCRACYHALPWWMRQKLYRAFGQGYEAAVWNAKKYLESRRAREKTL